MKETGRSASNLEQSVYDLNGRKVNGQPTKGVVIRDGRKVAVK